jgi:predicted DNA-binding transcriptional regulator AlpA
VSAARPELTPERLFLTVQEFCTACGISKATFYRLAAADKGPPITQVAGRSLIRVEAAEQWAEEQEARGSGGVRKPRGRATLSDLFGGRR